LSVTDITIRAAGSQKNVQVTIWPEFQLAAPIKKGDFVAVDGSFESRTYQAQDGSSREAHSISPVSLAVTPSVPRAERTVVQSGTTGAGAGQSSRAPF
jgi:single-stranded DNA-binding protein